jgi:uncharacterized membrane protein YgdD (TMEM256/DUF423 family)
MNHRTTLLSAGILGVTAIALGAFGAHGLRDVLAERGMSNTWETAARYHLLHAVALLGLAAWLRNATGAHRSRARWATGAWVTGTILFSGSLYWLALGGPRWVGPVTPFGGVALMVGWICLIAAAFTKEDV